MCLGTKGIEEPDKTLNRTALSSSSFDVVKQTSSTYVSCRNVRSEDINSKCINKEPVAQLPVYKGHNVHTYTKWHSPYYVTIVVSYSLRDS
jgi:hypothetical protein